MKRLLLAPLILLLVGCAAQPRVETTTTTTTTTVETTGDPAAAALAVTPGPGRADDALYRSLGELPGIERLIDALLAEVMGDLRINLLFEDADPPYLRARLIEQICEASGGPCTYTGLPMDEAHSGQQITPEQFGYFVEDLKNAMDKVGLAPDVQGALLGVLAPMQPQVVGQ
jgi:hemoglobin